MKSLHSYVLAFCLFTLLMASSHFGFAQPGNPSSDPDKTPISGIEILIGLGSLFGFKKLLDRKKKID